MSNVKRGRFSETEEEFIKKNHDKMTDKDIAIALGRNTKSVTNKRRKMNLKNERSDTTKKIDLGGTKDAYISTLDDSDRAKHFEQEVRRSARFKSLSTSLSIEEQNYYVEKYVEFMMDPTIETMTAMEKDTLHQMTIADIRIAKYQKDEYEDQIRAKNENRVGISRSREIRECQEVIKKCQESLNVERKQRLKNQSDQSITFTNLIRELKDPGVRLRTGREAAMLKFIAEQFYNDSLDKNILSGRDNKFKIEKNFKVDPGELSSDFLPKVVEDEKEDNEGSTDNSS